MFLMKSKHAINPVCMSVHSAGYQVSSAVSSIPLITHDW